MTQRRSEAWIDGEEQERRVIKAALEKDCTKREARVLGKIEVVGGVNYQTARQLAKSLGLNHRSNGIRESISRTIRNLAQRGLIGSKRVYCGEKMPGATWRSSHGSTVKELRHKSLDLKSPWTRAERRRRQMEHSRETRRQELQQQQRDETEFVSRCPPAKREQSLVQELAPDLAAVIEQARGAHERLSERRAAVGSVGRVPVLPAAAVRGPPE